ncbi:Nucleoprotein TPR [Termitomyces sp. J132]|nr:hypothetical protein H2248_007634 [Termitomyces sp. 'cryptogamus']KNZ73101.1 Nucleoprotein TPR [Termitomyces sp. J132]
MPQTRRQAHEAENADGARSHLDELSLSLPEDIDSEALSELLPDTNITSPTSDTIISIYRLLLAQALEGRSIALELDEARAEIDKKEVELDQALQDKETASRDLEETLESVQNELNQVKQEREQLAVSQTSLQVQIHNLLSSQNASLSEVDNLKRRIEDTEREKRDLVGVIGRLKQDGTQQDEEIQTLRVNLKEARQEHLTLESQVRELRSGETATNYKIESLSQQLQLAQAEAERTNNELTVKSEDFSKYRREKHAELANVQASLDALTETHAAAQSSLKSLQSSHTAQNHQLTQALSRVQSLQGQLADQEATYSSEANSLRRLVTMLEDREKQNKEMLEGLEREWDEHRDKSARKETVLREEIERERKAREVAEKKAEQLEGVLDRMERGELPIPMRGTPGTPFRTPSSSNLVDGNIISLSPTVAMASKTQRKGKGFTEVYADYVRLQEEYAAKCAEYDYMDRTLSSVLGQIEERAPILSQQRAEYERLKSEAAQLASQLAQAINDRDVQTNLASDNTQKLQKSIRENELLQKQLYDLGRQVQGLLREVSRRDDPTIPSDEDLDTMGITPAEDTEAVISNHLVLFRSVGGLQEQNQKLLKIVREMGRKMEAEERDYREAMEQEQAEAIKEAHAAIQDMATQLDMQKKSSDNLIKAYVKERDALRDMLAREKAGSTAAVNGALEQQNITTGSEDVVQELADTQSQFEAYRLEMGIDTSNLQKALVASQKEASGLAVSLAKANAQLEYLAERHRTDQDQLSRHDRDLAALSKRYQDAYDRFTRAEIESNRATEELQVATGRVEQLRNDCANLKAEKKIWESIQIRLVEENKTLALERSKLSDLMSNVQRMHNDLERSGENDRRRLENQLQGLESQTSDLRVQLSQERDNLRHLTLQKEIELKELQMRIDKNLQEHSKTREGLVSAETSKRHLEERVEELTRQLQGNEEKIAVYERRSSGVNGVGQSLNPDLTHEQQLEAEVAELRSSLRVTEVDLATARTHVQQFQEISRANEEALANLNSTYDEYKMTMERQIARHESECQALKEKLETAEGQLRESTVKYNDLHKSFEAERVAWANDKKTLEDTIVDMSTSEKNSESDRTSRENEVRQQEERARAAEDRYSNEVIAHADSMKTIEVLKRDLVAAQATARDNLTAAETAKVNLATSESSWKHQKEALEKEIADLTARTQDLNSQNALLHNHLESVSNQANRIKLAAESSSSSNGECDGSGDVDTKLSELRSVVSYLRKEKEIVDLQLELSKQENSRLKAQVDHLSQSLEEVRTTLSEEREKTVASVASAAQHTELLERINQLNLLRESNATLRADSERHAKRARELDNKLRQLSQDLDPAKEQARLAQAELQACKAQIARLEEEGRKWQERNAQLLSKYDRIDPAEVAALRDEIEQLKSQKVELERLKIEADQASSGHSDSLKAAEERIKTLEENVRRSEETAQKVRDHVKRNLTIFNNKLANADAQKKALEEERSKLQEKVKELEKTISDHQQASNDVVATSIGSSEGIVSQAATIAALQEERDKLLTEKSIWEKQPASTPANSSATDEAKSAWEAEKASLIQARDEALIKLKTATEEAAKVAEEAKNFKRQSEKFQVRISDMMKAKAAEEERQAGLPKAETSGPLSEEAVKRHAEELRALEMKLRASHQKELAAAREAAATEALLKAKSSEDNKTEITSAVSAAIAEHEKTWTAKQAGEIEAAIERGRMEQVAKGKLKDAQLVRAQKKVKDLEAQILEWRTAGLVPEAVPATPTTTTAPSNSALAASTSTVPATPTIIAPTSTGSSASAATAAKTTATPLPRKPSLGPPPTGPAARGGAMVRGTRVPPRGGMGRGAAQRPAAPAAAAAAAAASAGGVSIIGAATKRPREPETPASDDSLAKRLKPAEGTAISKPPVTIRRPAPGPPS